MVYILLFLASYLQLPSAGTVWLHACLRDESVRMGAHPGERNAHLVPPPSPRSGTQGRPRLSRARARHDSQTLQ